MRNTAPGSLGADFGVFAMKLRIIALREEHDVDGASIEVAPGIRLNFKSCGSAIVDVPQSETAIPANPAIDPNDTTGNASRN